MEFEVFTRYEINRRNDFKIRKFQKRSKRTSRIEVLNLSSFSNGLLTLLITQDRFTECFLQIEQFLKSDRNPVTD